jgi:hypothetical protein
MTFNSKLGDSQANSYCSWDYSSLYFTDVRLSSAWLGLSREDQEGRLMFACQELDVNSFRGSKYYPVQRLQFPRDDHEVLTGTCATPCTATSFFGTNLYSSTYNLYPTDFFKDGTVHITAGPNKFSCRNVLSSNALTGKIVVDTAFDAVLTATSQFLRCVPLAEDIKKAQCEQAFLTLDTTLASYKEFKQQGVSQVSIGDVAVNFFSKSGSGPSSVSVLGMYAARYLSRYLRKDLRLGRA